MNMKQGLATLWLITMITMLKIGTIFILCAMHIDLGKALGQKGICPLESSRINKNYGPTLTLCMFCYAYLL